MSSMKSNRRKNHIPAMIIAFLMTGLVAILMLAFGVNALFNTNVTLVGAAPALTENANIDALTPEELRALVVQYQTRETQYLSELTQAAEQLNQSKTQVQQLQSTFGALQNAGVIQIDANGQVLLSINQPSFFENEHDDD